MLFVPQQGGFASPPSSACSTPSRRRSPCCRAAWRFRVELPDGSARAATSARTTAPLPPARARTDRLQRPGQCARLPDAGGGLRGRRRAARADRKFDGRCGPRRGPLAVQRGRLARQLAPLQVRHRAASMPSARSASTIRIRRSSPCSPRPDTAGRANCDFVIFPPRWLVCRTHSARPGSTAT